MTKTIVEQLADFTVACRYDAPSPGTRGSLFGAAFTNDELIKFGYLYHTWLYGLHPDSCQIPQHPGQID